MMGTPAGISKTDRERQKMQERPLYLGLGMGRLLRARLAQHWRQQSLASSAMPAGGGARWSSAPDPHGRKQ